MKIVKFLILICFMVTMFGASFWIPGRGDRNAPVNKNISRVGSVNSANHYIKNAIKDAMTPNMVTVTLADYRGFDTLGEETVVFTAGLVTYLLLRRRRKGERKS